jgi:hypothetical protein
VLIGVPIFSLSLQGYYAQPFISLDQSCDEFNPDGSAVGRKSERPFTFDQFGRKVKVRISGPEQYRPNPRTATRLGTIRRHVVEVYNAVRSRSLLHGALNKQRDRPSGNS